MSSGAAYCAVPITLGVSRASCGGPSPSAHPNMLLDNKFHEAQTQAAHCDDISKSNYTGAQFCSAIPCQVGDFIMCCL